MERKPQPTHSRLIEQLGPYVPRINFYRFCQLVELACPDSPGLGSNSRLQHETIRFRPDPGMGFPVSELKQLEVDALHPEGPVTVRTTFIGLYGVESPLPTHYIDEIAQQQEGTEALSDFLDIFNHRLTTQFYRIWRKYSYPATFQTGGSDDTSQYLLGLVGLGIGGSEKLTGAPLSRFLALLGTLRLPTRTAEGITALVRLLAPGTQARITPHDKLTIHLSQPVRLSSRQPIGLKQRPVLGQQSIDVNSQVLLTLQSDDPEEIHGWLPGGQLQIDLLAMLRVYLGARCHARLQLALPRRLLPEAQLVNSPGTGAAQLGRTAVLKGNAGALSGRCSKTVTVNLGRYQGLQTNPQHREAANGNYRF
ncbi:MAG: type VI secretion system baseplate subunit TssG [Pseudomonas sp.]